jgi:hypothetical protein
MISHFILGDFRPQEKGPYRLPVTSSSSTPPLYSVPSLIGVAYTVHSSVPLYLPLGRTMVELAQGDRGVSSRKIA